MRNQRFWFLEECGGVARLKRKGIDGRAPPGVELAAKFDSTLENSPGPGIARIDRMIAPH